MKKHIRNYDDIIKKHQKFITGEKDFLFELKVKAKVNDCDLYSYQECIDDPAKALKNGIQILKPSLEVKSDFIPSLCPIQSRMMWPIASMLGCSMSIIADDAWANPIITDINQIWDMEVPSLDQGVMPKVIELLEYFKKNAPPEIPITPPSEHSPFNVAYMLRGTDLYLDIYDHPEHISRLLEIVTETFIKVERCFKEVLCESNHYRVSMPGIFIQGLRIAADSSVNLNSELIRQFEMPYLEQISQEFGPLVIHYCGSGTVPGYQFADVLSENGFVKLLHTQMDTYLDDKNINRINHNFKIASIGLETNNIRNFIQKNMEKLRNSHGAIFFIEVESKEKANEVMRDWPSLKDDLLG